MDRQVRLMAAAAGVILLLALPGCSRPETAASPVPADRPAELDHPPYDQGHGELTGRFVRSEVATYPAGSVQRRVPFQSLVVRWGPEDSPQLSRFLINGYADLVVEGETESQADADRVVAAVNAAGAGAPLGISYAGSDLVPTWTEEPPADFPSAILTTVTVGAGD